MQKYKTKCKYVINGLYLILLEMLFCHLDLDSNNLGCLGFYCDNVIV